MELLGNLSRETVQMFKDQRKHNIQRTFVTGSDAANARVTKHLKIQGPRYDTKGATKSGIMGNRRENCCQENQNL